MGNQCVSLQLLRNIVISYHLAATFNNSKLMADPHKAIWQKQRTGDILDCLLKGKNPATLPPKAYLKPGEVLTVDSDDDDIVCETPQNRLLHQTRFHPQRKKKFNSPSRKNWGESGSGKILDNAISAPDSSKGALYLDEYLSQNKQKVSFNELKKNTPRTQSEIDNDGAIEVIDDTKKSNPEEKKSTEQNPESSSKKQKVDNENSNRNKKPPESNTQSITDSSSLKLTSTSKPETATRRLKKELMAMHRDSPEEIELDGDTAEGRDMSCWKLHLKGPKGTLYVGEKFTLQLKFGTQYPNESPIVTFVGKNIPIHPHVYSNGHICLSTLTEDWSPALSVRTLCLSIISMLASATEKVQPYDNKSYVAKGRTNPKDTKWAYHDDKC